MVRSASAMSMPPVKDTWPMPPPYGPRRLLSSESMICMARTCKDANAHFTTTPVWCTALFCENSSSLHS